MMSNEKVLYDSDEAALLKTVTGWFSKWGRLFKDEHSARYDGCTHQICDCGNEMRRGWVKCCACRNVISNAAYEAMPEEAYNGQPVVLHDDDRYFFCIEDIEQYCEDAEIEISELQLVVCVPNMASQISIDDIWCDDLPEDTYVHDITPAVAGLEATINELVEEGIVLSWTQGKYRTSIKGANQ